MLIFLDPPQSEAPKREPRAGSRDFLAVAAVILAIVVSLAGVCLVIIEASAGPSPTSRVTIAAE